MVQGGDFSTGNGRGGESIYGGTFEDENFVKRHDQPFLLSMANRGKNTNGSQFFILTKASPHLDGSHVVFGHVISGQEIVKEIEKLPVDSHNSRPLKDVTISNCGELVPQLKNKAESKGRVESKEEAEKDDKEIKEKKSKRKKRAHSSSSSANDSSSSGTSSESSSESSSSGSSSSDSSSSDSEHDDKHTKQLKLKKKHHHLKHKLKKRRHSGGGGREDDDDDQTTKKKMKKEMKKKSKKLKKEKKEKNKMKKKEFKEPNDLPSNETKEPEVIEDKPTDEIDPNCSVKAGEIPDVPTNNFLSRDIPRKEESAVTELPKKIVNSNDDVFARREERRKNNGVLTSSGRKIKGRGSLRYRTPSPSVHKSGTETPPHWKSAQSRLKSIDQVLKGRNDREIHSNRRASRDFDFRQERRSSFHDDRRWGSDRPRGGQNFRDQIDRFKRNRNDRNSDRFDHRKNGFNDHSHHVHRHENREEADNRLSRDLSSRFVESNTVQVGLTERRRHSEERKKNGEERVQTTEEGGNREEETKDRHDHRKGSVERVSSAFKHSGGDRREERKSHTEDSHDKREQNDSVVCESF